MATRQALREFYRLKQAEAEVQEPVRERSKSESLDVPHSVDDVNKLVAQGNLGSIARARTGLAMRVRELDSEQKALVYNNYKKLIRAAEALECLDSHGPLAGLEALIEPVSEISALVATQTAWGDEAHVESLQASLAKDKEAFDGRFLDV